jgi:hypothetical protein
MAIPNGLKTEILKGSVNMSTDTIKVALLTATHSTNIDTQKFWSDVSANEITGTGYTAGGQALANKAVTQDNVDDEGVFDADDITWATATITARYAVVYKDTGVAGTSLILAIIDFGANKTSTGGDFVIQWNTEGIINAN